MEQQVSDSATGKCSRLGIDEGIDAVKLGDVLCFGLHDDLLSHDATTCGDGLQTTLASYCFNGVKIVLPGENKGVKTLHP